MKKIILLLAFLLTAGISAVKAQVRVVVHTPCARVVVARPVRPVVVVRPVARIVIARPALVVRSLAVVRPLPVIRRRVFIY